MAHYIEEKLKFYLDKVNTNPDMLSKELMDEIQNAIGKALHKQFNEVQGKFRFSMSAIGRPLCQLQMHKNNQPKLDREYNDTIKMLYGDIIEALIVPIMKAAGITIQSAQEHVVLKLKWLSGELDIPGTLDLVIDNLVWDVKSVSGWAFKNKFTSYESVKADDAFGYVPQLYLYGKAKGLKVGGWILICKETGEIRVVEFPQDQEEEQKQVLVEVTNNVKEIIEGAPFRRSFQDIQEKFRKNFTGSRYLCKTCEFCPYRFTCWTDLVHSKALRSEAKDPPWRYYTHIEGNKKNEDSISQS